MRGQWAAGDRDRPRPGRRRPRPGGTAGVEAGLAAYGAGRVKLTRRWFGWFEDQGLLGRYPETAARSRLPGAAAGAVVPPRPGPDASRRPGRHRRRGAARGRHRPGRPLAGGHVPPGLEPGCHAGRASRGSGSGGGVGRRCGQCPGSRRGRLGGRAPPGRPARAQHHLGRATRLRPLLTCALPYFAVQTLLELGRACLALDDHAGARVVLRHARDILRRRPDLGSSPARWTG